MCYFNFGYLGPALTILSKCDSASITNYDGSLFSFWSRRERKEFDGYHCWMIAFG